jgi:hypothetical protein
VVSYKVGLQIHCHLSLSFPLCAFFYSLFFHVASLSVKILCNISPFCCQPSITCNVRCILLNLFTRLNVDLKN